LYQSGNKAPFSKLGYVIAAEMRIAVDEERGLALGL